MPEFEIDLSDHNSWEDLLAFAESEKARGAKRLKIDAKAVGNRSKLQNKSLHQGIKHITRACNEHSVTMEMLFREMSKKVQFPVDERAVKTIVKAVCKVMFGEETTTAIPSDKLGDLWQVLERAFAERLHVDIGDLPSMESMRIKSILKQEK